MLINDFFKVLESNNTDNTLVSLVKINAQHTIFDGHFPNNPVTPGVVQLQMVKELLEQNLNKNLALKGGFTISLISSKKFNNCTLMLMYSI